MDARWPGTAPLTPKPGSRRERPSTIATSKEARARLSKALAAQGRGQLTFVRGRVPTVQEYAEGWLSATSVRLKTGLRYRELLGKHVVPALGRIQLSRLEPQHVDRLLGAKHAAGVAAKTCNHIRATLRACLNDAIREGLVARNAAALARPLKLDDSRPSVILSPEQLQVMLGLRWSTPDDPRGDVDLDARTLRITKTLQRTPQPLREEHGEWLEQSTRTRRSTRTILLAEIACEHLHRQRAQHEEDRLRAGARWTDDYGDLVFRTANVDRSAGTTCQGACSRR